MKLKNCKKGTKVFLYSGWGRWPGIILGPHYQRQGMIAVDCFKEGACIAHPKQLRKRVKKK